MFADKWGDFDDWAFDWSLVLDGSAIALGEPKGNPISGIRLLPPDMDHRLFIRERRALINDDDVMSVRV